jgi:DNA polymerase-1
MRPKLFLLDANALLHRSWHAIRPLTSPDGRVVNCVYGMTMSVMKLVEQYKPDAFAACWDTEAPTFRHEAYKEYKGHRKEKEQDLYDQIPWVQEGFEALGIPSLFLDGYEADDLLGTIGTRAVKEGWDVTIITGDRDALQLVRPHLEVMLFVKGVTEVKIVDEKVLLEEYGFTPEQFIDFKAIQGDTSDNIPGIRGIGEVGAKSLLKHFGSLKGIMKAAHDPKSEMRAKMRETLLASEDIVPAQLDLVTIRLDVPLKWKIEKLPVPANEEEARMFLLNMGFVSLLKRLDTIMGKKSSPSTGEEKDPKKKTSKSVAKYDAMNSEESQGDLFKATTKGGLSIEEIKSRLEMADRVALGIIWEDPKQPPVKAKAMALVCTDGEGVYLVQAAELKKDPEIVAFLGKKVVAHDVKAVMHGLHQFGVQDPTWDFDTMLAAYVLNAGERSHDLRTVALMYADITLATEPTVPEQVLASWNCIEPLKKALKEEKLTEVFERFELPLAAVLGRMESAGIEIDTDYLHELAKELKKEQDRLLRVMQKTAGADLNPASPAQLSHVLFDKLQLPTKGIKKGKTGFSTAASELEKLRGSHEIIEQIEDYREVSKLLSTYVEVIPSLVDKNRRLHTTFQQAVAATGRLSSADPNVQNIPIRTELGRRVRTAFVAKRGYELVSCDYSQIELRLIAALAQDARMIEAFEKGLDIHQATASRIWNIPLEEVTKEQRRAAKAINFGIIYGQGPVGLSQTAGISFADAKLFIANYFKAYPGIKTYLDETKVLAKKQGYIETIFGRRRPLPELNSELPMLRASGERMAINMPVQGTAADMIKLAMMEIDRGLASVSEDSRMLLQVHDELVFEVPTKDVQQVAAYAKRVMEGVADVGVPIQVDSKHGKNWEEMKSL